MQHIRIILAICTCFILFGCRQQQEIFPGIPRSGYFDRCETDTDFGETIRIGDRSGKFLITLPYEWDIRHIYSDTLYGLIASDEFLTGRDPLRTSSISVSGYTSELPLYDYAAIEAGSLQQDATIRVIEGGRTGLTGTDGIWLLFEKREMGLSFANLVVYAGAELRPEVYIIQATVVNTENYRAQICKLSGLIRSFEILVQ